MKRTIRENINTPYSLHDMNVFAFEVTDNDIVMRTQSGMVETGPLNILLFSGDNVSRNESIAFVNSLYSISCSTLFLPETHSLNSSNTANISLPPRLSALLCLYLLNDKFLVILPRKVDSILGL